MSSVDLLCSLQLPKEKRNMSVPGSYITPRPPLFFSYCFSEEGRERAARWGWMVNRSDAERLPGRIILKVFFSKKDMKKLRRSVAMLRGYIGHDGLLLDVGCDNRRGNLHLLLTSEYSETCTHTLWVCREKEEDDTRRKDYASE